MALGAALVDEADRAQIYQEQSLARSLASVERVDGESADNCIDCGAQISSERQLVAPGCQMCIDCATIAER